MTDIFPLETLEISGCKKRAYLKNGFAALCSLNTEYNQL